MSLKKPDHRSAAAPRRAPRPSANFFSTVWATAAPVKTGIELDVAEVMTGKTSVDDGVIVMLCIEVLDVALGKTQVSHAVVEV